MHRIFAFFFFIFISLSHVYASDTLIVSYGQDKNAVEEKYLKLKVYLLENSITRKLQNQYALEVKMQQFEEYYAVVLPHIQTMELRNELFVLLKPIFPHIFYIHEKALASQKDTKSVPTIQHKPHTSVSNNTNMKRESWIDEIGLQWLAIWLLSVIGLVLSIRNRRKMVQIDKTQKDMKVNQTKIEKEIQSLGDR